MDMQAKTRQALKAVKARFKNSVTTVAYNGTSAVAVRNTINAFTSPDEYGERGLTSGTLYVDLSEFAEPPRGATITIDGNEAFVTQARTDPEMGLLTIDYQDQNPVT